MLLYSGILGFRRGYRAGTELLGCCLRRSTTITVHIAHLINAFGCSRSLAEIYYPSTQHVVSKTRLQPPYPTALPHRRCPMPAMGLRCAAGVLSAGVRGPEHGYQADLHHVSADAPHASFSSATHTLVEVSILTADTIDMVLWHQLIGGIVL